MSVIGLSGLLVTRSLFTPFFYVFTYVVAIQAQPIENEPLIALFACSVFCSLKMLISIHF